MTGDHPETELIPYLRDELAPAERERIAGHLGRCESCRDALEAFRGILRELRASAGEPPEIDWRRYRAELRTKLDERVSRHRGWSLGLPRLVPVAATAALGVLALMFTLRGSVPSGTPGEDFPLFDQAAIGSQLDLLENYALLEHIDLIEDLDVVQELDEPTNEG